MALREFREYTPDYIEFARVIRLPYEQSSMENHNRDSLLDLRSASDQQVEALRYSNRPAWLAHTIYSRTIKNLEREAVEDLRIDFEDGYGSRPDYEEDAQAITAAKELARGMAAGQLPPFIGGRIKPFSIDFVSRSIRTLDLFITTLTQSRVDFPPISSQRYPKLHLPNKSLRSQSFLTVSNPTSSSFRGSRKVKIMIETTQAILNERGECTAQGLLNYFVRAVNCGTVTDEEAQKLSGLTIEELYSGSFLKSLRPAPKGQPDSLYARRIDFAAPQSAKTKAPEIFQL